MNGKKQVPFQGVDEYVAKGHKAAPPIASAANYPGDGDKRVKSLAEALEMCGLADGMTLSTHHHFRNGDLVGNLLLDTAAKMGKRDLMWFPSASFPCHAPVIGHMEKGVVHHIEGSMNGPLGDYCTDGKMRGMGVLRSHGGRWQAIQDGEVHVDIAVIAAPCADAFGNANGVNGPAACGSLNFALADSLYADKVIVVTDHLVPFPAIPWQIQGNNVDSVVVVDKVGDPSKIVSGTTEITKSPDRLLLAELVARFVRDAGIMRDGFSFQAGAGGTALAFAIYLKEMMKKAGVKARFIRGGSTKYLVEMLERGPHRLHPRRPDLRPGRRGEHARQPAPRGHEPLHELQLPRQGLLRDPRGRRGPGRHRGGRELQRQRGDPLRRPAPARHRRLAELPLQPAAPSSRSPRCATASPSSWTR